MVIVDDDDPGIVDHVGILLVFHQGLEKCPGQTVGIDLADEGTQDRIVLVCDRDTDINDWLSGLVQDRCPDVVPAPEGEVDVRPVPAVVTHQPGVWIAGNDRPRAVGQEKGIEIGVHAGELQGDVQDRGRIALEIAYHQRPAGEAFQVQRGIVDAAALVGGQRFGLGQVVVPDVLPYHVAVEKRPGDAHQQDGQDDQRNEYQESLYLDGVELHGPACLLSS